MYTKKSLKSLGKYFGYTDLVEPLSLGEAYLDVTNNEINLPSVVHIDSDI